MRTATAAALLAALALGEPGAAPPRDVRGTYRMEATLHLDAAPLPRELALRADAVVSPGAAAGEVRVRLAARGQRCELGARLDGEGGLRFASGQACPVSLRDEATGAELTGTLRRGTGRIGDGRLSLELAFELGGVVRLGPPPGIAAGRPLEVPVAGSAVASARGNRDESRAAER